MPYDAIKYEHRSSSDLDLTLGDSAANSGDTHALTARIDGVTAYLPRTPVESEKSLARNLPDAVSRVVAEAPSLTAVQREMLAVILGGGA